MLNLKYYSSNALSIVVSLLKRIETLSIGETRALLNDTSFLQTLRTKARISQEGVGVASLGALGGNIAFFTPKSYAQLEQLVNQLDREPQGRRALEAFKSISGNRFFMLADTTHEAVFLRKQFSGFLAPAKFIKPVIDQLDAALDTTNPIPLRETISGVVRLVLVKKILGIDALPPKTYSIFASFSKDIQRFGAFPFPSLLNYLPDVRKKRAEYKRFTDAILKEEFNKVVTVLKSSTHPEQENLLAAVMVELIRKDHPHLSHDAFIKTLQGFQPSQFQRYFESPMMRSLPMLLNAADNLTRSLVLCIAKLVHNSSLLETLQGELDGKPFSFNGLTNLKTLKDLPILDAFYKESVRHVAPIGIPRYTQKGLAQANITIPPKTMILIDFEHLHQDAQYWKDPEAFDPMRFLPEHTLAFLKPGPHHEQHRLNRFPFVPFSAGKRMCPAFNVTEVMFKALIARLVSEYSLTYKPMLGNDFYVSIKKRAPSQAPMDSLRKTYTTTNLQSLA